MGTESFDISECNNDRSEDSQPVRCELLGSDVFLEGLGIDPTELASISVRWECVIRARGVVSTTGLGR